MAQIPTAGGAMRGKPGLDIYGVLLIIATVFVATATIYVFVRSGQLLGTPLPIPGDVTG